MERSHPSSWFQVANELHDSLLVLYNSREDFQIEHGGIMYSANSKAYMLLAAYSLENLIKSILVVETPDLIKNHKINNELLKHDLCRLYKRSQKIKTNAGERRMLAILSKASVSWGRYPIPRHFEGIEDEIYLTDKLHKDYMTLFNKSRTRLYNMTKKGFMGIDGKQIPGWLTNVV